MASLFGIQFGSKFPSTKQYEASIDKGRADYEKFINFESSELLKRYEELDGLIHSGDFENKVRELKNARYKDTPQWRQLDQYRVLKSASDIKTYLKFAKAGKLERMQQVAKSDTYKDYLDLKKFVNSAEFHSAKSKKDFKQSEAYTKNESYKALAKSSDIKFYLATEKKQDYKTVLKLANSERLKSFFELEAIVQTPEFVEHKSFMEDKKRFAKSNEAHLIKEFEGLKKNEEIKWYHTTKKKNPFQELHKWQVTFEDDFDAITLDNSKWMTGYYWGKALMNDTYVPAGEKQFFRDDNIELRDSIARIHTRNESVKGKSWDLEHGFTTRRFDYTSGLISTGQSFRQKYGKFEAKVKFSASYPLLNAFWMAGEKMTPHLDIFKSSSKNGKSVECGVHMEEKGIIAKSTRKVSGAKFNNGFFIYSCEWSPESIVWKINGQEVARESGQIPSEPMYLSFCTILPENPDAGSLPAMMEIDWVRCFKKVSE